MQSAGHAVSRLDALLCVPAFQQVCQGSFNLWESFLFLLLYLNTISQKIQENFSSKSHFSLFLFYYCILFAGAHLAIVCFSYILAFFSFRYYKKEIISLQKSPRSPHPPPQQKSRKQTFLPARKGMCEGGTFAGSPFASNQGCGSRLLEKPALPTSSSTTKKTP